MPLILEKQKPVLHPEAPQGTNFWRLSWKRAAIWALLLFGLLNAGLFRLENSKRSADVWRGTGSIDLAVNEFNSLKTKADVVLLGSSLVMYPFWSMDKGRDPQHVGDIFHHHGSAVLEGEMRKAGFSNPHVFSFAIFGQMVSDAYIYVNEFLKKDKAPEYLIYGIAPRDFSDYDLSSPMATNTFKRLVNLDNLAPYANLYLPGFQDKADFVMSRLCYFYSHRWRLQQEFNKVLEKAYIAIGIHEPEKKVDYANAGFMLFGGLQERWDASEKEYARRYKNIAERDLSVQMGFLKRLVELSRERGTKVVIVNMPLSEINRNLLPPGFYTRFRQDIAKLAEQPGVKFVDIGDTPDFTRWDFWDTAHLGPAGGEKVLTHILPALKELQREK
ncbi:MAG: DUF1574 domain-containing protein [Candidatus Obscuribacterales bacterium]|nr:DUF1574 domain-containing protein [Candidatus Obscuribacterales bacterium]